MTPEELNKIVEALDERSARRMRRWMFAAIALAGVLVPGVLLATTITVPYSFTANTPARASEVNANFAALSLEATRVSNIVIGPGDGGNTNKVVNLAPPIAANDAANKAYIDAASGGGGAEGLTLYGATTCPTGWTIALSGQMFIGRPTKIAMSDTTGITPAADFSCIGAAAKYSASGLLEYVGTFSSTASLFWVRNYDGNSQTYGPCVICVK